MQKLYYSIGETAEMLGENVSLVRFWSNNFSKLLKPTRNTRGNRVYTDADIEVLKQIHYLVKDKGLSLEGAQQQLLADRRPVEGRVKALESLKAIRAQLVEIKKSI